MESHLSTGRSLDTVSISDAIATEIAIGSSVLSEVN